MIEHAERAPIVLLYVEDDPRLGRLTSTYLQRHQLVVHLVTSGEQALDEIGALRPDVVVLDVMLPGMSGQEVCRQLRHRHDVPIIMVSALDEEVDRVLGLESGADDYVTKPFSSRELLARIHAQARRARGELAPLASKIELGALVLDEAAHEATLDGAPLPLTSHELTLLMVFARHVGRVLSREQLIALSRERGDEVFDRAIDVQISRLRQKLGDNPRAPSWIKTVRGIGYVFTVGRI